MKHTRQILSEQRKAQPQKLPDIALESFLPYLSRHESLEAAKAVITSSPIKPLATMSALLVESMGYGTNISLESFESDPQLSLEAAQEENIAAAKKKASDFSNGVLGWIQKTFTARGKIFKEIDDLIAKVSALEGKECELSAEDKKKFGQSLAVMSTFEGALSDFKKIYDVVEKASFARIDGSLNALKAGTDPARIYDGLIENFVKAVSTVINVKAGPDKQGILNSPVSIYFAPQSRIGTNAFLFSANLLDINGIKNKEGEVLKDPYAIAHFYEAISKNTYVIYGNLLGESHSELPRSFKEVKNVLVAFRGILDDCFGDEAVKQLRKAAEEQRSLVSKMKMGEGDKFANFIITISNVASGLVFFQKTDEVIKSIYRDIAAWAQTSIKSVKE